MKNSAFFIAVHLFCVTGSAISQERVEREKTSGHVVFYESHSIQLDTAYRVIIPLRIRYDFFVFIRPMTNPTGDFAAGGEIIIELIDSTETSVARNIQEINLTAPVNTFTELKFRYLQKFFSFDLPVGRYSVVLKIEDKESKRSFIDHDRAITIPTSDVAASGLIPFQQFEDRRFKLYNLDGDVLFSQDYGFVFLSSKLYTHATYSLLKLMTDDEDKETIILNQPMTVSSFAHSSFMASEGSNGIELSITDNPGNIVQYIQFDGRQLRQGRYELQLTFPDSTTMKTSFGAQWLDMPSSLTDLNTATEPLQFITSSDEYSDLRSGGRETRIKKFDEFWQKKDATPETAYNEVMHEFYRRVDFANTSFRTLRGLNGAITDRGKIYILYGKPTTIERILNPDGAPKEIWNYNSHNKIFTFEDPSKQGNYKLAENK